MNGVERNGARREGKGGGSLAGGTRSAVGRGASAQERRVSEANLPSAISFGAHAPRGTAGALRGVVLR